MAAVYCHKKTRKKIGQLYKDGGQRDSKRAWAFPEVPGPRHIIGVKVPEPAGAGFFVKIGGKEKNLAVMCVRENVPGLGEKKPLSGETPGFADPPPPIYKPPVADKR